MQTFFMVVLVFVLMMPLLLAYGLPFIAAAVLFCRLTRQWLAQGRRFALACGIAALGIAPAFDQFWQPRSIYLCLLDGDEVNPWAALASFALTWLIVWLQARKLAKVRRRQYA